MSLRHTASIQLREQEFRRNMFSAASLQRDVRMRDDLVKIAEFGEKVAEKVSGLTEIPEKIAVRGDDPVGAYYTPLGTDGKPAVFLKAKPKTDPGEVHEMRNLRDCLSDGIDPEGRAGYLYRNLHQVPGLHQGMSDRSKIF